jgi:signal transduction histidine kinase
MVAVGFREGNIKSRKVNERTVQKKNEGYNDTDPYINKHSRILSRLLYFINVTTKELEDQNNTLKLLNEQKNEFLGIAAHDLRNPLGVILGFSELLGEKVGDDLKIYTDLIYKTSSTMLQLLNDLLDISKIEAGKLELRKKNIDYIELVKQNIKMNNFFAQGKDIQIISEFELSGQTLFIDESKIDQVLNNLIGNAVKYSYPNSTIKVRVFEIDNLLITQVIDHGPGIPSKELNDIFFPFRRTSVRPTNGESSHGLGLAIVKKIIEGHGGQVGVKSKIKEGSTFTFTLPVCG